MSKTVKELCIQQWRGCLGLVWNQWPIPDGTGISALVLTNCDLSLQAWHWVFLILYTTSKDKFLSFKRQKSLLSLLLFAVWTFLKPVCLSFTAIQETNAGTATVLQYARWDLGLYLYEIG